MTEKEAYAEMVGLRTAVRDHDWSRRLTKRDGEMVMRVIRRGSEILDAWGRARDERGKETREENHELTRMKTNGVGEKEPDSLSLDTAGGEGLLGMAAKLSARLMGMEGKEGDCRALKEARTPMSEVVMWLGEAERKKEQPRMGADGHG